MKLLYTNFFIVATFSLLSACGGGSSSGGSSPKQVSGCSNPSSTSGPYLSTSYDSCEASDSDMTGLWVLVSEYSIISNNAERNKQQRVMMLVTDNNDGTLNAQVCNRDKLLRNYSFSSGASELNIYDDIAQASIDLSITSNLLMQGAHVGSSSVTVQNSSVAAIKIKILQKWVL